MNFGRRSVIEPVLSRAETPLLLAAAVAFGSDKKDTTGRHCLYEAAHR